MNNKKIQILFYLLFPCFFTLFALAQEVTIIDAVEKKAIAGVHVFNQASTFTATSDPSGKIFLKKIAADEVLTFSHITYQDEQLTLVQVKANNFIVELYKKEERLPEFVIAAGKVRETLDEVTNKVEILKAEKIAFENPQTSADVLANSGNVYVQKSQMGGGSPVIRGFEANKVLLVVDGVRMNNAIYRGGHLQNAITLDAAVLDRVEVVFGPGSVIYGSDALGGVMHFFTKKPPLTTDTDEKLIWNANAFSRFATANNEKTGHIDIAFGGKKLGSLTSFTYSDFDDLRIGTNRPHGYEDWGKRFFYAETINGVDSLIANPDENKLRFTGYSQMDFLQKLYYQASETVDVSLNFQYSNSSDIPRFDRLNDETDDGLRFAEWYYGPQKRILGSAILNFSKQNKAYDNLNITAAYQRIDEDRINRRFGRSSRTIRQEDVNVYSLNVDAAKKLGNKHTLQYGAEITHNDVQSTAFRQDISTEQLTDEATSTRYPDGGSQMTTYAGYLRHKWKITPKLTLTDGFRYSHIRLQAAFEDTSFFNLPVNSFNDSFGAVTGSIGLVFKPVYKTKLNMTLASGFRAPNIDDAAKVFDPAPGIVVVPNFNIKPEYAWNIDFGIEQKLGNVLKVRADAYYNYLTNLIRRDVFTLNGQDSLVYDGELMGIFANTNAGQAFIAGAAFSAVADLGEHITIEKKINYAKGRDISNDQPLGHIPPVFGSFMVKYQSDKLTAAFDIDYNAKKDIADYGAGSTDKPEEALAIGTPAWYTLNAKVSYDFTKQLNLTLAAENILDQHYKPFASGLSGAGRNFVVALRAAF